ncbi:N-acetylglucosamine-6-phosphate deacetylase [Serratia sp. DD3]|uniref:N-acetylglucosamine-6-phosphate deacetylase n=1 Tax=Serratia sp. DD3 TaxID=1410619 RepID=UPI0003C50B0B|nr:N-acetylglucosamine-6-phosphate deacetylase [Serratia sp. DD3]KEY60612.1 N-acetylglucosamine-6-phosphate deacetylase [Serratia sp. DD3]
MSVLLRARRVLTDHGWLDDHQLRIEGGIITTIEPIPINVTRRDAELLCPAYIDLHVHGGAGLDVMDDKPGVLDKLALYKASEGVGYWLPTTVTAPLVEIENILRRIAHYRHSDNAGAVILGSYLEGPYFTPHNRGAHPAELFRELDITELDRLIDISHNTLRVVALAAEKPGALAAIKHLKSRGIRVMLGHSAATYDQTMSAFSAGADGLVHCFNGMSGLHHRDPGMVGAGLTDKQAWLELIADGHHLHPAVMDITCRCAKNRIILITDAMRAAGMPDGDYAICGYQVTMRDGVVRTASGSLAGSTLALDAAVRNLVDQVGVSAEDAIRMASLHPARLLGLDDRIGSISPGKHASVIALDSRLRLQNIWLNGVAVPL